MRHAVAVIVVCTFSSIGMFVYLQATRASLLRPIGDVTEAEIHQTAVIEVVEIHQCEWEHKGVLSEC